MKANSRRAFQALTKLGAPVYENIHDTAEFIIGGELRTNNDNYFADYYQHVVKEKLVDGKVVNAMGVRQDVLDVLSRNGLQPEWINPGQLGVFQA